MKTTITINLPTVEYDVADAGGDPQRDYSVLVDPVFVANQVQAFLEHHMEDFNEFVSEAHIDKAWASRDDHKID